MKRFWSWVSTLILDDPSWGLLPDDQWKAKFLALIHDPENIHCETDRTEYDAMKSRLKKILWQRDPNKCAMCGSTDHLEIDHIKPLAKGGTNELDNLQILCRSCNRRKSTKYNGS